MNSAKVRASLVIFGEVQGVGYRAWTKRRAQELGLTGWVRNCDDGSVEACFEGEQATVLKMVEECNQGPRNAQVERIEEKQSAYTGEFKEFLVRH